MRWLRIIVTICATAITAFKIYVDGDGVTVTALFTLYGALFGSELVGATSKEK